MTTTVVIEEAELKEWILAEIKRRLKTEEKNYEWDIDRSHIVFRDMGSKEIRVEITSHYVCTDF